MKAKVVIEFTIKDVISDDDLRSSGMTFQEIVTDLIESEGIAGIAEDDYSIKSIESV